MAQVTPAPEAPPTVAVNSESVTWPASVNVLANVFVAQPWMLHWSTAFGLVASAAG